MNILQDIKNAEAAYDNALMEVLTKALDSSNFDRSVRGIIELTSILTTTHSRRRITESLAHEHQKAVVELVSMLKEQLQVLEPLARSVSNSATELVRSSPEVTISARIKHTPGVPGQFISKSALPIGWKNWLVPFERYNAQAIINVINQSNDIANCVLTVHDDGNKRQTTVGEVLRNNSIYSFDLDGASLVGIIEKHDTTNEGITIRPIWLTTVDALVLSSESIYRKWATINVRTGNLLL